MSDSTWDMLSAIGTLAAVAVALGVSGHAAWKSRCVEKDKSELAAAKMLSPLSTLESMASYLAAVIGFRNIETSEPDPILLRGLIDLEELSKSISIDDLYALLNLPNHSAKRASRSLGLIQTLTTYARPVLIGERWASYRVDQRDHYYKEWSDRLSEISDLLLVAKKACEDAAAAGAPHPSRAEIQGKQAQE